jgi:hypothetical protein
VDLACCTVVLALGRFGSAANNKEENMFDPITLVAAKVALGAALALGLAAAPHGVAAHDVTISRDELYASEVGDDDGNGIVEEDESGWSCVDDGNRVCGPNNAQGVPAGRYDEGGVLVDPWPADGYN